MAGEHAENRDPPEGVDVSVMPGRSHARRGPGDLSRGERGGGGGGIWVGIGSILPIIPASRRNEATNGGRSSRSVALMPPLVPVQEVFGLGLKAEQASSFQPSIRQGLRPIAVNPSRATAARSPLSRASQPR